MKRRVRAYSLLMILFVSLSCSTYVPVIITKKKYVDKIISSETHKFRIKKYFLKILLATPIAKINNHAIGLALKGELRQSEILFQEVLKEEPNAGYAYNNLGVVFELMGEREKAYEMYSKANIISPGNTRFKKNYMSQEDFRGD